MKHASTLKQELEKVNQSRFLDFFSFIIVQFNEEQAKDLSQVRELLKNFVFQSEFVLVFFLHENTLQLFIFILQESRANNWNQSEKMFDKAIGNNTSFYFYMK